MTGWKFQNRWYSPTMGQVERNVGRVSWRTCGYQQNREEIWQWYYWELWIEFGWWCYVTPVQQLEPPETRGLMHQYNVGALFERIVIPISSLSRGPERKLIPPDSCGLHHQESEVCTIRNQKALTMADLAPIFFFHFGIQKELQSDQGRISSYSCCSKCYDASYFPRHAQPPTSTAELCGGTLC
jgi:hypothetical protein